MNLPRVRDDRPNANGYGRCSRGLINVHCYAEAGFTLVLQGKATTISARTTPA